MDKNKITINKKVFEKCKKIEVYGDVIVPDIKPDIINIINTNANAYVYKLDLSDGKVKFDGNVDTIVVYLADSGETRSIQTTLSFNEIIENTLIKSNMKAKEKICLINVESKILNERKISIKICFMISIEVYENEELEFINQLDEMTDIQKLEEKLMVHSLVGQNNCKTSIKEKIKNNIESRIAEILKVNIEVLNIENKISYNKVLAKADANIKIIYISEENKIEKIENVIPIMTFIEMQNISDTNMCKTEYNIRNMIYKIDTKDMMGIELQIEFDVNCNVFENKEINVIQDMYSIKNDISFNKKEFLVKLASNEEKNVIKIDERALIEDINSICDTEIRIIINDKIDYADNYEGEVCIDVLFEADNRNGLNFQTISIPFMFKSKFEVNSTDLRIINKNFNLNNEYVLCNIDMIIEKDECIMKKVSVIDDISLENANIENEYKMFVYFVKKGDTVWNIAKKFRVCMDSIIKNNNLESPEKINIGDRLYIMK